MKKILFFTLLLPFFLVAQVGINTTTPKAALDIESANNGMLIPRVQLTSILDITTVINPNLGPLETSTLVYNMAAAGIAPNNVVAGFYYWNGSRWISIVGNNDKWSLTGNAGTNPPSTINLPIATTENFIGTTDNEDLVFGSNNTSRMKISAFGNVGIGTETPTSKLHVATIDENIGITNNVTKNADTGTSYNIHNNITINNNNPSYGIRNSFLGSGTGLKIGASNTASAGILGSKIGFENNLQASGNSYLFGFKNILTHTGSDLTLGLYNQITNPLGSTGTTHGIENRITNNSTLEATGVYTEINSPDGGSGGTFGMQNIIGGRKTGNKVGVKNEITTDVPGILIGVNSRIISSPSVVSSLWGSLNDLFVYADSNGTGTINNLFGNTNGSLTGVVNYIDNDIDVTDPNLIMVGTRNQLRGLSNANKYGTLTTIETTADGIHYGIHSTVLKPGANNFAGYFLGNVGIGTATANTYTFPPSRGTNGQIMQTDGAGNLSWQNPGSVISNISWSLLGNSITSGTHFIGSTNDVDVSFRRNGTNVGYLGQYNVALGIGALQPSSGVYNVAIGVNALSALTVADQNVALGWNALSNVTTGGNNIGIGTGAVVPSATANNQIRMGNVNIGYAGIQVAWTITSDSRWKDNIKPSNLGLDFINKLNPVSYFRKNDTTQKTEYGFIAQELDKTLNEFGASNNGIITKDDEGMLSVRYNDLLAPMVKAIQELKSENDALKQQNESLESRLKAIEEKLKHNP